MLRGARVPGREDEARRMSQKPQKKDGETVFVKNRRAFFDYDIEEKLEGGLVLVGSEVKSIRAGKVEMVDAFCSVDHGELFLKQMYIAPFEQAKAFPHEPRRARKVLMHKHEIDKLDEAVSREGYTLVPLRLYTSKGRVKVEIGIAKGRKQHDKRAAIAAKPRRRECSPPDPAHYAAAAQRDDGVRRDHCRNHGLSDGRPVVCPGRRRPG